MPNDDWTWELYDLDCEACGQTNQLHRLPPDLLAAGDVWECRHCGAKHQRGGTPAPPPTVMLECAGRVKDDPGDPKSATGPCGRTFTAGTADFPEVDDDGTWTCPTCGTAQRSVAGAETAAATTEAVTG